MGLAVIDLISGQHAWPLVPRRIRELVTTSLALSRARETKSESILDHKMIDFYG